MKYIKFLIVGVLFGIVFVKAEIISWYRMQEMFRFQSFHMYGVIGSAVVVGMLSLYIIRKLKLKSLDGQNIELEGKQFHKGFVLGSFLFGIGWALTGACPGPLYAQIGAGYGVVIVTFVSAVLGTFVYGVLRHRLPH